MLLAPSVAGLFKWRQFEPEMILLAVGWYLRFSLSYRDVEELLAERGLHASNFAIFFAQTIRHLHQDFSSISVRFLLASESTGAERMAVRFTPRQFKGLQAR
jgi:hypothetical protein